MTIVRRCVVRVICCLAGLFLVNTYAAPLYRVTNISAEVRATYNGPVSGTAAVADINAAGHGVGWINRQQMNGDERSYAYAYQDGRATFLPEPPGTTYTIASALNDLSQIAGERGVTEGRYLSIWNNGAISDITPLLTEYGRVAAINNSGQVVGNMSPYDAFFWDPHDGLTNIRSLLGGNVLSASAYNLNNHGQVVGSTQSTGGPSTGWSWGREAGFRDLGVNVEPHDINDRGQIVGSDLTNDQQAFLWEEGNGKTRLGLLPGTSASSAYAINELGQVVGVSGSPTSADEAFIWTEQDGMQRLGQFIDPQDPLFNSVYLLWAWDINDRGQILAWGTLNGPPKGGDFVNAVLLTPVPVPAPASQPLLLAGILMLSLLASRRVTLSARRKLGVIYTYLQKLLLMASPYEPLLLRQYARRFSTVGAG